MGEKQVFFWCNKATKQRNRSNFIVDVDANVVAANVVAANVVAANVVAANVVAANVVAANVLKDDVTVRPLTGNCVALGTPPSPL